MKGKISEEKELEAINAYTASPLSREDVYTFTVTLCDNEVDRDYECFTEKALISLAELFQGKTGISDHSMRSKDQKARIFNTYLEYGKEKTSYGEGYIALKAQAYTLRNEENAAFISEISGGIKKEVSISCSVNKHICSVCGGDMKSNGCKHLKGRSYEGKLCYAMLSEPADAYEWSFVAVPAQRKAGVTKAFEFKEEKMLYTSEEIMKSICEGTEISFQQAEQLRKYVSFLEQEAQEAAEFKECLFKEIERLALITMPKVGTKAFLEGCKSMKASQLRELKEGLEAQAREKLPMSLQLSKSSAKPSTDKNTQFKI